MAQTGNAVSMTALHSWSPLYFLVLDLYYKVRVVESDGKIGQRGRWDLIFLASFSEVRFWKYDFDFQSPQWLSLHPRLLRLSLPLLCPTKHRSTRAGVAIWFRSRGKIQKWGCAETWELGMCGVLAGVESSGCHWLIRLSWSLELDSSFLSSTGLLVI